MKTSNLNYLAPVMSVYLLAACNSSSDSSPAPAPTPPQPVSLTVDFNDGEQEWTAGFSDYPVADADLFELAGEITQLPNDSGNSGYRLKGMNRSDDLFMYLKHQVSDLVANETYTLHGSMTFLSNAGIGCIGIGGAPGESVFVKVGASEIEPEQVDFYLNVDKGNQSQSGNDAIAIGHVAAEGGGCGEESFGEKTIEITQADGFEFQASTDGSMWVFLGTDSGYEGLTDLYYTSLQLTLTPDN